MFESIDAYAGDPILTLNESFATDDHPRKVNLSIGVYLDDDGKLPLMEAVRQAEAYIAAQPVSRPYAPMEGSAGYRRSAASLVFGAEHPAVQHGLLANVQTLGGSGALKVGADFLARYFPQASVWICRPTWDNHHAIMAGAGMPIKEYPYYDAATGGVAFQAMMEAVAAMPRGDVILLHACCHNPTGADLSQQQWEELACCIQERGLLPFFDMAYQGVGNGIDEDAFAVRYFAQQGIAFFLATSFSKNFSLYGERCGLLSVLCNSQAQVERVLGQLKFTVRRNYSSPPVHGAKVIATILDSSELSEVWRTELAAMRSRVRQMRLALYQVLSQKHGSGGRFGYLLRQTGMFSYTGLSAQDVDHLRDGPGVYLLGSGRICLSALTARSVDYVADALAQLAAKAS